MTSFEERCEREDEEDRLTQLRPTDCGDDTYKGACQLETCSRCAPRIAAIMRVLSEGFAAALTLRLNETR